MKINLGCGRDIKKNYVNVDTFKYDGVDVDLDLTKFPWRWADNSVDEIYTSHVLEHIFDNEGFLKECHRVLKKGGLLHVKVPHVTSVTSLGNMGHYRGYCYDTFKDYLSQDYYMFGTKRFNTIYQKITWFRMEWAIANDVPSYVRFALYFVSHIMNFLIGLSPRFFENIWCYLVGGAREVEWKGIKI